MLLKVYITYAIIFLRYNVIGSAAYANPDKANSRTPKHKPNRACGAIKRHLCDGEPVGKRSRCPQQACTDKAL